MYIYRLHIDFGINNPPGWFEHPFIDFNKDEGTSTFFSGLVGTLYGLSYVVIVNLILQAVISTLIMDTFGAMRGAADALSEDITTKCFICSINRDEFEQVGVSFTHHILNEHNMWKYLFFKMYLDLKDPLSFSGPEHYAFSQMGDKQKFIRLMPVKRSLTLERKSTTGEGGVSLDAVIESLADLRKTQNMLFQKIMSKSDVNDA
jgi:hypothetical protein